MPGLSIGTVYVSVAPTTEGFADKLRALILPQADAIGRQVGQQISEGINSALRDIRVNATVDLDTSAARAALDDLGSKSVSPTIGLDDSRIVAALDDISVKLDRLDGSVTNVRLELEDGTTVAQLDEISLKLDEIGSRDVSARLSLDDSGFNRQLDEDMAKLSAAGAASGGGGIGRAGLITGAVLGGLTAAPALPGVLAGGGAAIGTLGLAVQGIGPALSAYTAMQTAAATATGKTGAAAISAASQIHSAQQAVSAAETTAAHDAITSAESIKNAHTAVAQAVAQAVNAQISAEQTLANAQYAEKAAQQALTDARQQAILTLQQLRNAEADTTLSAEQAQLDLEQAQLNAQTTNKSATATALQKAQADLSVREAQQRLTEALQAKTNAANASNKADKEGVNGLPAVVAAQHNLAQSHQSVADAQRALTLAEQSGAASIAKAQQSLADAVRNASWQQQGDALSVSNAQYGLKAAYDSASAGGTSAATAAAKYAYALSQLSPAGQSMVKEIVALKPAFDSLKSVAQTAIAPGFVTFLQGIHSLMPVISAEVKAMGGIIGDGLAAMGKAFSDPAFQKTLTTLFDQGNKFIQVVGPALGGFLKILGEAGAQSGSAVSGLAKGLSAILGGLGDLIKNLAPAAPAIGAVLAGIGQMAGSLGGPLGTALGQLMTQLAPAMGQLVPLFAKLLTAATPLVVLLTGVFAQGLTAILTGLNSLVTRFPFLTPVIAGATIALIAFNIAAAANPIGLVVVAIVAAVGLFAELWTKFAPFRDAIKDIGIAFIDVGLVIVGVNKGIIDAFLSMIGTTLHAAVDAFGWVPGLGSSLKTASASFDGFKGHVDGVFDSMTGSMNGWKDSLNQSVSATHDATAKIQADIQKQADAAANAQGAMANYNNAIRDNGVNSSQAKDARDKLIQDLINAGVNSDVAKGQVDAYSTAVAKNGFNSSQAATARQQLVSDIVAASKNSQQGKTDLDNYSAVVAANGTRTADAQAARAQLIKDLENSGLSSQAAGKLVDGLGTSIVNLPADKKLALEMKGNGTYTITNAQGQAPTQKSHAAAGMYVRAGTGPTADDVAIMVSRGELVVPAAVVASGAVDHLRGSIPGFAQGGVVGGLTATGNLVSGNQATPYPQKMYSDFQTQMTTSMVAAMKTAMASGGGAIVNFARSFLGKIPYVWGGTSLSSAGADCSGFTQSVYGHFGIGAPRTSEAQGGWVKRGPPIPGGLAFYHSPGGGPDPGHVAIVADASSVISQGGGMGPKIMGLNGMPLLWTGTPPGGLGSAGGTGGNGSADGTVIGPGAAAAQAWMKAHMGNYGWGAGNFPSLQALWDHESGWRYDAQNPSSPAYGIPQADPGSKMAADGSDWRTNPVTQMRWGAEYIKSVYGTPANAWNLWQGRSPHWYDEGGWLPPGPSLTINGTGRPEPILTGAQWDMVSSVARGGDGGGFGMRKHHKQMDRLIHLLEQAPARTAGGVAAGINGAAHNAVMRGSFRTR